MIPAFTLDYDAPCRAFTTALPPFKLLAATHRGQACHRYAHKEGMC